MLREYQLTNFKAFAGPETLPIRPITLIYGPNSSGKSSILQSLLLLKQTLEETKNTETLLLPKGPLIDLGSYREFVHRHETNRKFSFKVTFDPDTEWARYSWFKELELLKAANSASVGLQIIFAYVEENVILSSVEVFIGEDPQPVIVYEPENAEAVLREYKIRESRPLTKMWKWADCVLGVKKINSDHGFWRTWWAVTKNHIEHQLSQSQATFIHGRKGWEYISGSGREEEIARRLENYPFEKAIKDLKKANQFLLLDRQNFLPDNVRKEPHTDSPLDIRVFYPDLSASSSDEPEAQLDISPLTFHVCSVFRELVWSMDYLGPLRHYPEPYYILRDNLTDDVGKSGELVPHILFKHPGLLQQVNEQFAHLDLGYELKVSSLKKISSLEDEKSRDTRVFTLDFVDKKSDVTASIMNVGFGVSQVLPIIVQSVLSRNRTLLIEQPEIHLHPALQAELGDLFIQSALGKQRNTFLLETHSEHLLLRIMRRMRETFRGNLPEGLPPVRPQDVAVLYVERDGEQNIVREMPLNERGELVKAWPGGFFEEGLREVLPSYAR